MVFPRRMRITRIPLAGAAVAPKPCVRFDVISVGRRGVTDVQRRRCRLRHHTVDGDCFCQSSVFSTTLAAPLCVLLSHLLASLALPLILVLFCHTCEIGLVPRSRPFWRVEAGAHIFQNKERPQHDQGHLAQTFFFPLFRRPAVLPTE